jgi:hypothetical protein
MDLDAQLKAEREARQQDRHGLSGPATMDLMLYSGADVEYTAELMDEEAAAPGGASRASLPQRVIQQHNLEAEADGDAAMKRFRAENSTVSTAKIAEREDEVRVCARQALLGQQFSPRRPLLSRTHTAPCPTPPPPPPPAVPPKSPAPHPVP